MGKQIYIPEINAYLPDLLKEDIDILIDDVVVGEMDLLVIIDGKEGSGKSYDARLIGKYIASVVKTPFSVPNIHFNTAAYIEFSESKPKHTVNVLDESREALNKKRGMSSSNVGFTNWLSENRDKQQIHIIVLPAIHDLDSYISIWRMKLLIHKLIGHTKDTHTRSKYKLLRGYFRVYDNTKHLQQVLFNKQKYGYYAYPKRPSYERKIKYSEIFTAKEMEEYKEKKRKERFKKYNEQNKKSKSENKYKQLIFNMNQKGNMTQEEIARIVGKSRTIVGNIIRDFRNNADTSKV